MGIYAPWFSAMLGTQSGPVAQTVTCASGYGYCGASGLYSNGLSATSMEYNIGLFTGDVLYDGTASFTASEGYSLSEFTISH